MFFVGDTGLVAKHYWATAKKGNPIVPDIHYDEMSVPQLKKALTYCKMAYNTALRDGCRGEALQPLLESYQEVFNHLYALDERFREWVTDVGRTLHPPQFLEELSED